MVTQTERFLEVKEKLADRDPFYLLGADLTIRADRHVQARFLTEVEGILQQYGFSLLVLCDGKSYVGFLSDKQFDNSEAGVKATEILSVPYEWGYLVFHHIFDYFEQHDEFV